MIATNWIELCPAYGRSYKSKAEVESAFRDDKDFEGDYSLQFKLCSIRDFEKGTKVLLRYKNNTMTASVTV